MTHTLIAVGATLFAALVSIWAVRTRMLATAAAERLSLQTELATLTERLRSRDVECQELRARLEGARRHELDLSEQLRHTETELAAMSASAAEQRANAAEKQALLEDAQRRLAETFRGLSAEALRQNNQSFLEIANATFEQRQQSLDALVKPLSEKLGELERARVSSYSALTQQLVSMAETQELLRAQTVNLVTALRAPAARGRWGEIQLRRVVEMAGMIEHCDFLQQASVERDDGRLRPDVLVNLPGGKRVVVDAKAPLQAFLEALELSDGPERQAKLREHAQQVRTHLKQLGDKAYWDQLSDTPEFVVMFVPGEAFFSAALEQDPSLIEYGVERQVILATPTTLIALLRAVAYGWRQEALARNAEEIRALGQALHDRLRTMTDHFGDVRKGLDRAVTAYNSAMRSLESRVLVSARRFKELGAATGEDISTLDGLEKLPLDVQAPQLGLGEDPEADAA